MGKKEKDKGNKHAGAIIAQLLEEENEVTTEIKSEKKQKKKQDLFIVEPPIERYGMHGLNVPSTDKPLETFIISDTELEVPFDENEDFLMMLSNVDKLIETYKNIVVLDLPDKCIQEEMAKKITDYIKRI